jgi:general stress protein YciG
MDPKLVSELAKRGGKAAHRAGTAHQFTSEEARVAGRKGGIATHAKRRADGEGSN